MDAARVSDGQAAVVAYVPEKRAIALSVYAPSGGVAWTQDVLTDIEATADARVNVYALGDRVAVLFDGKQAKQEGRVLAFVNLASKAVSPVERIAGSACATASAVVWMEARGAGIRMRSADQSLHVLDVPQGAEVTIACSPSRAFAFVATETKASYVAIPTVASEREPKVALTALDATWLETEDEREHDFHVAGDAFAMLRVSNAGQVSLRYAGQNGARILKQKLRADDDIVLTQADAKYHFVLYSRGNGECENGLERQSLRLLRVDRQTGDEWETGFADATCGSTRGPFWFDSVGHGYVFAWSEMQVSDGNAMASRLAFATAAQKTLTRGAMDQRAAQIVSAGCAKDSCLAFAVEPAPEQRLRVLRYP